MRVLSLILSGVLLGACSANDPAGSWLSYADWTAPNNGRVTAVNTTWTVPDDPTNPFGSNAPGWWFGIQTAEGDGALIQPILAYGYLGHVFTIFNGVFDWTDGSWHTSSEKLTVKPGDKIVSSVTYKGDNTYEMYIYSTQLGKGITTPYTLESRQHDKNESRVFFVLEHQPSVCRAYPKDGAMSFENIVVQVDGATVTPNWAAKQEQPACSSKCTIVDAKTIKFTWDPATDAQVPEHSQRRKWSAVEEKPMGFSLDDTPLM